MRRGARDLATLTCLSMSVAGARDVDGRNLTVSRCWLWCACHDVDGDADGRDRVFSGLHYVSSLFREARAGRVARGVSEERAEGPGHTDMWDQKPEGGIRINGINGKKS